jgi:tetratricopeptide (TPR) repeat protein
MAERAIGAARSLNQRTVLPRLLVWLSLMRIGRGEMEEADRLTTEAWELSGAAEALHDTRFIDVHTVVPAHIGRATYHLRRGDWSKAVSVAEAGLEIADRTGYVVWAMHHLLPIIAEASVHARDLEKAAEVGARIRAHATELGHALGLAWAEAGEAILTWLQGNASVGAEALRRAAESMERIPMTYEAARLRRQLAGRLADIGDREGALRELRMAYDVFRELGARPELEKALLQFGELGEEAPA